METNLTDEVICRTCLVLTDKNKATSIYTISEIIMLCASITKLTKILEFDGLPPHICSNCHEMAQTAYKFRLLCEKSDAELRNRLVEPFPLDELVLKEENVESSEPAEESVADVNFDSDSNNVPQTFNCEFCSASFLYKTHLRKHMVRHKNLSCHRCGKKYRSPFHLAQHMNVHNEKCSQLCDICGKQITLRSNLVKHLKIHTGEKPHQCSVCKKNFIEGRDLKTHMISHNLERPYLCSFCGKRFPRPRTLSKHIERLHSPVRFSFPCELCGKSFKGKEDLSRHMQIHIGERQHICKVCDKAFNRKSNLTVHERIHNDDRPYVCAICERGFNQKHVLITHMEKTHRT